MTGRQHERFSKGWWLDPVRSQRLAGLVLFAAGCALMFVGIDDGQGDQVLGGLFMFVGWWWFVRKANQTEAAQLDGAAGEPDDDAL